MSIHGSDYNDPPPPRVDGQAIERQALNPFSLQVRSDGSMIHVYVIPGDDMPAEQMPEAERRILIASMRASLLSDGPKGARTRQWLDFIQDGLVVGLREVFGDAVAAAATFKDKTP